MQKLANETAIDANLNITKSYINDGNFHPAVFSMSSLNELLLSDLTTLEAPEQIAHYSSHYQKMVGEILNTLRDKTTTELKESIYFEQLSAHISTLNDALKIAEGLVAKEECNHEHKDAQLLALDKENDKLQSNLKSTQNTLEQLKQKLKTQLAEIKRVRAQAINQLRDKSRFVEKFDEAESRVDDTKYRIIKLAIPLEKSPWLPEGHAIQDLPFTILVKSSEGISVDVQFSRWGTPIYPKTPFFGAGYPTELNLKLHHLFLQLISSKAYKTPRLNLIHEGIKTFGALEVGELQNDKTIPDGYAEYAASVGVKTLFGVVAMRKARFAEMLSDTVEGVSYRKATEVHDYLVDYSIGIFDRIEESL